MRAGRARVEQWMDWQAGELNNAWRYAFMALVRKSPAHTRRRRPSRPAATAGTGTCRSSMRSSRSTGAYAAGPAFTLADIVLGLAVHRWLMTPDPASGRRCPPSRRMSSACAQRPAFLQHASKDTP